jgi:hypothetical protein
MYDDNHSDPHMAMYYMELKASRFGSYPTGEGTSTDTCITQPLTDGSTIQLTLDPDSGTWMLARFFHEQGQMIVLYQQHGEYDENDE